MSLFPEIGLEENKFNVVSRMTHTYKKNKYRNTEKIYQAAKVAKIIIITIIKKRTKERKRKTRNEKKRKKEIVKNKQN